MACALASEPRALRNLDRIGSAHSLFARFSLTKGAGGIAEYSTAIALFLARFQQGVRG